MPLTKNPKRTDTSIDFGHYNKMSEDINKNNNISFDPLVFNIYKDGVGTFVSLEIPSVTSTVSTRKQLWDLVEYGSLQPLSEMTILSNCFAITNYNMHGSSILGVELDTAYDVQFTQDTLSESLPYIGWIGFAISSTNYIYLELNRSALTATLKIASSLPAGTDSLENKPLYYMTASNVEATNSSSEIIYAIDDIIDMRTHISMDAMS